MPNNVDGSAPNNSESDTVFYPLKSHFSLKSTANSDWEHQVHAFKDDRSLGANVSEAPERLSARVESAIKPMQRVRKSICVREQGVFGSSWR